VSGKGKRENILLPNPWTGRKHRTGINYQAIRKGTAVLLRGSEELIGENNGIVRTLRPSEEKGGEKLNGKTQYKEGGQKDGDPTRREKAKRERK